MRTNTKRNQKDIKIKEFINLLETSYKDGIIDIETKEKFEYDCAIIQANEPDKLIQAIDRITETLINYRKL